MQSGVSASVNLALFSGTYRAAQQRKAREVNPVSLCLRQTSIGRTHSKFGLKCLNERQEQRSWCTLRWMMLTAPSLLSSQPLPLFLDPLLATVGNQAALTVLQSVNQWGQPFLHIYPPCTPGFCRCKEWCCL